MEHTFLYASCDMNHVICLTQYAARDYSNKASSASDLALHCRVTSLVFVFKTHQLKSVYSTL